jgi:cobalt/nickel transport system ATP-binding protein
VRAFGAERRSERDFRAVRSRAAYLFQDPDDQLFCPTVLEDVAFGPLNLGRPEAQAYDEARATLAGLGLGPLAERITYRLSGGEKRLVSLAAVLVMRPELLLLDEPTNALDETHLALLTGILERLDAAMLIVSHDRPFVERLATRVLVLRDGRRRPATVHRHPVAGGAPHIHGLDPDHDYMPSGGSLM